MLYSTYYRRIYLYFLSIVCLRCPIMPLTMLYLYPHGLYSLLEFEIKSESDSESYCLNLVAIHLQLTYLKICMMMMI